MGFYGTHKEISSLLGVSEPEKDSSLGKVSCRGLEVRASDVDAGNCYIHLSGGSEEYEQAFQRGASLLILPEGSTISEEMKPYTVFVDSPHDALHDAFFKLISWWREEQDFPQIAVKNDSPNALLGIELAASILLRSKMGNYLSSPDLTSYELAAKYVSRDGESEWGLWPVGAEDGELLDALSPDKVLHESKDIKASPLYYLGGGRTAIKEPIPTPFWPIPIPESSKAIPLAKEIVSILDPSITEDLFIERLSTFIPPPHIGASYTVGDDCTVWIHHTQKGEFETLLRSLSELNDLDRLGVLVDGFPSSQLPEGGFAGEFIEASSENTLIDGLGVLIEKECQLIVTFLPSEESLSAFVSEVDQMMGMSVPNSSET